MKKTYIKVAALICVLMLAVAALGGTLFTIFQVNRINTEYLGEIHNLTQIDPMDYADDENKDINALLIHYNGRKYYSSLKNENIGYYSNNSWLMTGGTTGNFIDTKDFQSFAADFTSQGNKLDVRFIKPNDNKGNVIVYVAKDGEVTSYFFDAPVSEGVRSGSDHIVVTYKGDLSEDVEKNAATDPKKQLLNQEAEEKCKTIFFGEAAKENVKMSQLGITNSYVAYSSNFSIFGIGIKQHDVFVFHPLKIVLEKYSPVYGIALFVLAVLVFATVFLTRRMYVNRLSYEVRTQNLTRSFAHELMTPLAVTKTYVENWDIIDEKDRADVTAKINEEVDHMTKMVNTLLNLSQMNSGDVKLNLEEVELYELTAACCKQLEKISDERGIEVDVSKDDENGKYVVSADLDMMRIVISNFVSNAIKYGKEKVSINLASSGNNVVFKINNDGEPISAKDRKKIWDLFYKKDKSGTDRLGSTGVGLAVNKSILDLHKAKYGVESTKANGTTFHFEMKKAKE